MKNIANCKRVLDQIERCSESWDQSHWHCGSTHCFAGWAQILSGKPENAEYHTIRRDARIFLGISENEANYYFYGTRKLDELKGILSDDGDGVMFDEWGYYKNEVFDKNGFTKDGFNKDGYNRYGFDRDGLDRNNQPDPNL